MSEIPNTFYYTTDHEWIKLEEDGDVTIGITDHAQEALGELVFVELPAIGDSFLANDACAVVESVKAASDIYCPIAGEVVSINEALQDTPELINQNAYYDGWVFKLKPQNSIDLEELMNADSYKQLLSELED
ncbi:MAG: glycine cleavage system protein GcvH [Pseudomonadota bacterium]|nr:glycine cleavage system protein GcvH [Pseudomonadota bacterium]